jgi:hypothetical protein
MWMESLLCLDSNSSLNLCVIGVPGWLLRKAKSGHFLACTVLLGRKYTRMLRHHKQIENISHSDDVVKGTPKTELE